MATMAERIDARELEKFDAALNTRGFAPKETRDLPTVFGLADELRRDIEQLQRKLKALDDVLHKAMGALLDAAHTISPK
jgi:hypothetical protein